MLGVVVTHRQVGQVAACVPLRQGGARRLGVHHCSPLCRQVVLRKPVQAAWAPVALCRPGCGVISARRPRRTGCNCGSGPAARLDPCTQAQRLRGPRALRATDSTASGWNGVDSPAARRVAGAGRGVHSPRHWRGLVNSPVHTAAPAAPAGCSAGPVAVCHQRVTRRRSLVRRHGGRLPVGAHKRPPRCTPAPTYQRRRWSCPPGVGWRWCAPA